MYQGYWQTTVGFELKGKMLGLIGLGNIPQNIVGKAQAFGIEVAASDPYCPDDIFNKLNVKKMELDELLSVSDFVSLLKY